MLPGSARKKIFTRKSFLERYPCPAPGTRRPPRRPGAAVEERCFAGVDDGGILGFCPDHLWQTRSPLRSRQDARHRTARLIPPPNFGKRPAGPGLEPAPAGPGPGRAARGHPGLAFTKPGASRPRWACRRRSRKPGRPRPRCSRIARLPLAGGSPEPETIPAGKVWNHGEPGGLRAAEQPPDPVVLAGGTGRRGLLQQRGTGPTIPRSASMCRPNGPTVPKRPGSALAGGRRPAGVPELSVAGWRRARSLLRGGRYNLVAANWNHNAAIQNVAFLIIQSYFLYQEYRAIVQAEELAVRMPGRSSKRPTSATGRGGHHRRRAPARGRPCPRPNWPCRPPTAT
jgi:hypothetical protein